MLVRRLVLVALVLASATIATAGEVISPSVAKPDPKSSTLWYDLLNLEIEGKGWTDTKAPYDRLPAKAEGAVRDAVWNLSRHSAGLCARFVTDAPTIQARWTLTSANLAMPHMPATGVSGLDLYVKGEGGKWLWLGNGRPTAQTNTSTLATIPGGVKREYMLYLPLYNGVSSVEIGIPKDSTLAKSDQTGAKLGKPIVFYGTSITQGGCASRPGMVHTAILGRRLNVPVINLGFSGNGKMEPEMAALLRELDPSVYVLDCLPNLSPKETSERVEPFVRALREVHPTTHIVLVEDRNYSNAFLVLSQRERNEGNHAALWKVYQKLVDDKVLNLHYLYGKHLLGNDNEGTVDSSHPTDLGFMRQAEAMYPLLTQLLAK
jgi:hypothetical protein